MLFNLILLAWILSLAKARIPDLCTHSFVRPCFSGDKPPPPIRAWNKQPLVIHQTTFDGTLHLNAKSALHIYFLGKTAWKRHRRRRAAMSGRERECDWPQLPDLTQSELCRPSHLRSHLFPIHPRVILQRVNQQLLNSDPTPHPSKQLTMSTILPPIL